MRRAQFIVSNNGKGHEVRCGALADELRGRGWFCGRLDPTEPQKADVLIVDDPEAKWRREHKCKVVRLIDVPPYSGPAVDLVVHGGAASPQHALLRPEFRIVCWIGATSLYRSFDMRNLKGAGPDHIAWSLARARVAVTYAGMRALEAACIGTPAVIIPRNEGERLNAKALSKAGAAMLATEDTAMEMAKALSDSPTTLRVMSQAARALVDGMGCKRVADLIEGL